jgi:hypothetical protein
MASRSANGPSGSVPVGCSLNSARTTQPVTPRQLFRASGSMAWARVGRSPSSDAFADHLAETPVRVPLTNPIGCSVKWLGKDAHGMPAEACDLVPK